QPPPKYQLWPPTTKIPAYHSRSSTSDQAAALSVARSGTAMSDSILTQERPGPRNGKESFSRRRKISITEINSGPAPMSTLREACIDSPTIPGRPPLQARADSNVHERSNSSPGSGNNWRSNPFGDAMVSRVTGPAPIASRGPAPIAVREPAPIAPLSPILGPSVDKEPLCSADLSSLEGSDNEKPPEVPPKSPLMAAKSYPTPRQTPRQPAEPTFSPSLTAEYPGYSFGCLTPAESQSDPFLSSTRSRRENVEGHWRNESTISMIDRGRPIRRARKRNRSRTSSDTSSKNSMMTQESNDAWTLPSGILAPEASLLLPPHDIESLRGQALQEASTFEVLSARDVATLSKELRALDDRCEYLRNTYKSLREGRQKIQLRMISYLIKAETIRFSRESILKQEEALIELDVSIDDWTSKIDQAENRRLRIRQKLLEHVAAAVSMTPLSPTLNDGGETTPPHSPLDDERVEDLVRSKRRDVESIRIYADDNVLDLFSDIEQAMGEMCEG
ncbi:hypothetical protein K490DRAFT_36549, partial [Saccharata proteae CBS 121410]